MDNDAEALTELFATASLGAPENAIGFVLWRVFHRYQREVDRVLGPLDLTHLQFSTLMLAAWQGRSGQPATQAGMARLGDIHPMQISLMLKALEAKAMVTRERNVADVRAKCVTVTPRGIEALRGALPAVIELQLRMFGRDGRSGGRLLEMLVKIEGSAA